MLSIRQLSMGVLLCCLMGLNAIRLSEVSEKDDQVVVQKEGASSQALVPADYWQLDKATDRCKAARRGRRLRQAFGLVVGGILAIPVAMIAYFGTSVLYLTWYLAGSKDVLLLVSASAAGAAGAWLTFMAGRGGVTVASWTTDFLSYLFGQDGHKPVCCCAAETSENGTKMCGLVGSKIGRRPTCPDAFPNHDATQCDIAELLTFDADTTAGGCKCADVGDCSTNQYDRGHAWCKVQSSKGCRAWPFKLNPLKHWDYCQAKATDADVNGTTLAGINKYISQFSPNLEKGIFRADPRFVWRFGSWVDTSKALVIAPLTVDGRRVSACLPGVPEETLDGCAQMCLEEHAPVASEKGEADQVYVPCVAFAYNHFHRLCVRIPDGATGAEFKPFAKNPDLNPRDDGWSNYKLRN